MTDAQIRDWGWDWAKKLKNKERSFQDFFDDVIKISEQSGLTGKQKKQYEIVLVLTHVAYYEYTVGRFSKERSANQCREMSELLNDITKGLT